MIGAAIGAALTGLGALSGLFGSKKQTSDTNYSSTAMPVYDPASQSLRDLLIGLYKQRASGAGDQAFQDAYTTTGLKNLADVNSRAATMFGDVLSSRGLSQTSAGAGGLGDVGLAGAKNVGDFLTNIPLMMDTRRASNMAGAGGFLASLPTGTTTSGTSHTVGTVAPSSPLAGVISGAAGGLGAGLGSWYGAKSFGDILKQLPSGTK